MNFKEILSEIWHRQIALVIVGCEFGLLFLILAVVSAFDSTEILGINRWIKPMKFASSIAIYMLTLAVFLNFVRGFARSKSVIAWTAIITMLVEMTIIVVQAARGTTSHFNVKTAFDNAMFGVMGLMILINTLAIVYLLLLYFRAEINLPNAVVWGARLGLILFLLASAEGGLMAQRLAHSVGVADGGAGLPFFNWSTEGGDLRVAHFIGLHAIQIVPVASLAFVWLQKRWGRPSPTILTFAFALFYLAAFNFFYIQAMHGQPLFRIERINSTQPINNLVK